ncbi:helix-hairpin-helix domain-containing protein [Halorubrum halodurans]|uniref:Helix-hairpin-helix DNA-binding motif class 1 domain-containing protein n=1 Tax=Halorubrum halodurans TaxID=1383851 RepID=A0A256IME0_9EURY|nr:helix-hairpin-helix domain-containing protein [Halorubrum halodurans]OYR57719.1 hypothetical protein DJ70_04995 [Halorubrum halodurans]
MTEDLTEIDGVGDVIAEQLRDAGFETVADVQAATVDELAAVHMLGESSAKAILNDDDGVSKGREFELDEDDHDDVLEAAETGMSIRGCARAAGVSLSQLQRYLDTHDDFRVSFERARARGESELIEGGLRDDDVDTSMAKFLLASSFDYKKTERREVEADVDQTTTHELGDDEKEIALEAIRELQERESA